MAIYNGPEAERVYQVKFVRLDNSLYVTQPEERLGSTYHSDVANRHGIHEDIKRFKDEDLTRVDGGYIRFLAGDLLVYDGSEGYAIHSWDLGRAVTVDLIKEKSPGWRVFSDFEKYDKAHNEEALVHIFTDPEKEKRLRQETSRFILNRDLTSEELEELIALRANITNAADFIRHHPDIPLAVHLGEVHYFEHYGEIQGNHVTIAYPLRKNGKLEITRKEIITSNPDDFAVQGQLF